MNYKKGRQYWTEKEELLCQQWKSADKLQQYKIYNKLLPRLNEMAEYIIGRYYNVSNPSEATELKHECVQEVFIKLHRYEVGRAKNGSYSFCSLIIKHYAYNVLIYDKQRKAFIDCEYVDDYGVYQPIEYEKYEFDNAFIKKIIADKRKEIENYIKKKTKYNKLNYIRIPLFTQEYINLEILRLFDEYLDKFDFDINGVVDYIYLNSEFKNKETMNNKFRKLFGNVKLELKEDNIIENKYDMIDDDFIPNENYKYLRSKIKSKKSI